MSEYMRTLLNCTHCAMIVLVLMFSGANAEDVVLRLNHADNGNESIEGHAQVGLKVHMSCRVEIPDCSDISEFFRFEWDYGDMKKEVTEVPRTEHPYFTGGTKNVTVTAIRRSNPSDRYTSNQVAVHVITGIEVTRIGDETGAIAQWRLCFNTKVDVAARALPAGLPPSSSALIDWTHNIFSRQRLYINQAAPSLTLPAGEWPTKNSAWGPSKTPSYWEIDESHHLFPFRPSDQDGELITGKVSYMYGSMPLNHFYNATTSENSTDDPNWFYYYKDYEGGNDYKYTDAAQTSYSFPGEPGSIRIADNAYDGNSTSLYDYSNPGGRLKFLGQNNQFRYLRYFIGTVNHERSHVKNQIRGDPTDTDGDLFPAAFELTTAKTDPTDGFSAFGTKSIFNGRRIRPKNDGEVYADGPIERPACLGETGALDFAQPGTLWP